MQLPIHWCKEPSASWSHSYPEAQKYKSPYELVLRETPILIFRSHVFPHKPPLSSPCTVQATCNLFPMTFARAQCSHPAAKGVLHPQTPVRATAGAWTSCNCQYHQLGCKCCHCRQLPWLLPAPGTAGVCCGCQGVLREGGQPPLIILSVWGYHTHRAPSLNSRHGDGHRSATNLHRPRLLAGRFQFTCNHVYSREDNPPQHLPGIFLSSSPSSAGVKSPPDFRAWRWHPRDPYPAPFLRMSLLSSPFVPDPQGWCSTNPTAREMSPASLQPESLPARDSRATVSQTVPARRRHCGGSRGRRNHTPVPPARPAAPKGDTPGTTSGWGRAAQSRGQVLPAPGLCSTTAPVHTQPGTARKAPLPARGQGRAARPRDPRQSRPRPARPGPPAAAGGRRPARSPSRQSRRG